MAEKARCCPQCCPHTPAVTPTRASCPRRPDAGRSCHDDRPDTRTGRRYRRRRSARRRYARAVGARARGRDRAPGATPEHAEVGNARCIARAVGMVLAESLLDYYLPVETRIDAIPLVKSGLRRLYTSWGKR